MKVRFRCAGCNGTGKELCQQSRGWFTCLACGGTGYHERWIGIDDLADVLQWRAKRDVPKGGA